MPNPGATHHDCQICAAAYIGIVILNFRLGVFPARGHETSAALPDILVLCCLQDQDRSISPRSPGLAHLYNSIDPSEGLPALLDKVCIPGFRPS